MTNPTVPWKRPDSVYEDNGPSEPVTVKVDGPYVSHFIEVTPTELRAPSTDRVRYKVVCLTCGKTVADATTNPRSSIELHLREDHGYDGPEIGYQG